VPQETGQTPSDTAPLTAASTAAGRDIDNGKAPAAGRVGGAIPLGSGAPATAPQPAPATAPQLAASTSADTFRTAEGTMARPILGKTGAPVTLPPRRADGAAAEPAASSAEESLIADLDRLRASWLRLQAGFVDDPQAAVADAADLVEHTAQALVGALRQRQKQLRDAWEHEPDASDTEHLRLVMQRYRALFRQICRP
jgi:hypothetical protein